MQAGGRLHRKIQRRMGAGYAAEVPLKITVPMKGFDCVVEGRADGIFAEDGTEWIDEIKGVYRDLNLIEQPVGVHLAQALCYAYIYAAQHDLPQMGVQLTYGNLETEELKMFRETRSREELEEYMEHFSLYGEGGTDFRPAFAWVEERMAKRIYGRLRGLLYFTDGYGIFPAKMPPFETAFVFFQNQYRDVDVPLWAIKLILGEHDLTECRGGRQYHAEQGERQRM